jgi:DNA-binding MarR family transcriptional regulator
MPFTPFSFKRLVLLAGRKARAFAALANLTPARGDLMMTMLFEELSQKALSLAVGVAECVISRMVRALERAGLVARRTPPEDRRVRLVSLTKKGRETLDIFFDGWMTDEGRSSFQAGAEYALLMNFEEEFRSIGFHVELPPDDAGPALRAIRRAHASSGDYWDGMFMPETVRQMRCYRPPRPTP